MECPTMGHPCKPNMSVPKNLQRDTLLEDNQHGGLAPWGMLMPCNTVVNLHGDTLLRDNRHGGLAPWCVLMP